ncbi:MAG: hypothetical protein DRI65_16985, partial [Chloroflexota bacterium]
MRWKIGLVLGFVVLLILVLIGWQLAPRIEGFEPSEGELHGRQPLVIRFTSAMYGDSVESRLDFEPSQPGEYNWNEDNNQLTFTPNKSWPAGEIITLQLRSWSRSRIRLPLLGKFNIEMTVSPILLTYLWPADNTSNLYLVNPVSGENQALTEEINGVLDYSISANGEQIYYSSTSEDGTSRIMVLDRLTGATGQITSCSDGLCTTPMISPDGYLLAYEYIPIEP